MYDRQYVLDSSGSSDINVNTGTTANTLNIVQAIRQNIALMTNDNTTAERLTKENYHLEKTGIFENLPSNSQERYDAFAKSTVFLLDQINRNSNQFTLKNLQLLEEHGKLTSDDINQIALFVDLVLKTNDADFMHYSGTGEIEKKVSRIQNEVDLILKNDINKKIKQDAMIKSIFKDNNNPMKVEENINTLQQRIQNKTNPGKDLPVPPGPGKPLPNTLLLLEYRNMKNQILNGLDELEKRGGSSLRIKEIQAAKKKISEAALTPEESKILQGNNRDEIRRVADNIVKRFDNGLNDLDKIVSEKPNLFHHKGLSVAIGVRERIIKNELSKLASQETKQSLNDKINLHSKILEGKKPEQKEVAAPRKLKSS